MTQWAWIGPLGDLRAIPNPEPGLPARRARSTSTFTTLGGNLHVQSAPHAPRTWTLAHTWHPATAIAWLAALADGTIPGPHALYTADAATLNLLPSALAAPGRMGTTELGSVLGRVPVVLDGAATSMTGVVQQAAAGAWSQTIPLRGTVALMLSAWASGAGAAVAWRTVTAAGAQVATGMVTAAATSGGYRGQVAITPGATSVGLQVRTPAGSLTVGGLRLTEGPHDAWWVPGRGAYRVTVSDPEESLQLVDGGLVLVDSSVTIQEVG